MATSAPIFFGGLVRGLVDKLSAKKSKATEEDAGPGTLFSSGLIAGGSIAGIVLAILAMSGASWDLSGLWPSFSQGELGTTFMFVAMMVLLFKVAKSKEA